jgi:multiple sugar transport system ATP-binding protein
MATITFHHVFKHYGKVTAIRDAHFEIRDKEFMVLVGPSGCGKSTLLRMIAGLEEVSEGELRIDDRVVNDLPPKDRDIAIVFQNYALYPHMTTFDNMAFGLKIRGMDKKVIREKVQEAARILDMESLLDRKPRAMSGGQRQRVAIGRAIVRDPKVFLFDEPLSNLDAKLRGQMRIEIARLHQKLQTTVVYVTHDQVEAMTLGDRIAVIDQGVIQQIDTPFNLYNHPQNRFVAGFIGSPPMNFIDGRIFSENDKSFFEDTTKMLKLPLEDHPQGEVTLGIRPEHIHIQPVKGEGTSVPFSADIQFVERLGHESFAFTALGPHQIVARLTPDEPIEPPVSMTLHLDVSKLHFFDKKTGERVLR